MKYFVIKTGIIATVFAVIISLLLPANSFAVTSYNEDFYSNNDILFYDPRPPAPSCAVSGGTISSLSGKDNREKIWNFLTTSGLSSEQAAGVLGNIQSESAGTFTPTVNEISGGFPNGGYGIVQWTGGRRSALVDAMKKDNQALMDKYYLADYSTYSKSYTSQAEGFVGKSASTGSLIPVIDNDALLLTQLNFLYQESNSRTVNSKAQSLGLGSSGQTEWDALKKLNTVKEASDLWVYSFEIPADIDVTAVARVKNSQAIYDMYSNGATGAVCESNLNQTKQALAKAILDSGKIRYDPGPGGKNTKKILEDISSGTNNGNDWNCGMHINVLKMLRDITKQHSVQINSSNRACENSTVGGSSSYRSYHYNGNGSALDFGKIDKLSAYSADGAKLIIQLITPYLVSGSGVGQLKCQSLSSSNIGIPTNVWVRRFDDACTHLHVDIPPIADPNLKCKIPINGGYCPVPQRV